MFLDVSSVFSQNVYFRNFDLCMSTLDFFLNFFYMFWDMNLKLGIFIWWVAPHIRVQVSWQLLYIHQLYKQNRSNSFFYIPGLRNDTNPSNLVYICTVRILNPIDFRHGWATFDPVIAKTTSKGEIRRAPTARKFPGFFLYVFEISI